MPVCCCIQFIVISDAKCRLVYVKPVAVGVCYQIRACYPSERATSMQEAFRLQSITFPYSRRSSVTVEVIIAVWIRLHRGVDCLLRGGLASTVFIAVL